MFRFTIRDLLWLMVVIGLSVGWWLKSRNEATTRVELESKLFDVEYNHLRWADENLVQLAKGWQQDRPDRIKITEDQWIMIHWDTHTSGFRRPRMPE